MRNRLFFVFFPFAGAILQTIIFPANFVLPVVILREIREEKNVALFAFWAGIVTDLISGNFLGISSGIYITVVLAIKLLRLRQKPNIIVGVIFILLSDYIYGWVRGHL